MDTSKKTLTCERAQDLMFLYIEGQLKERDAEKLTVHLDGCEACRKELEERKRILKSLGECEFIPPSSLKSDIMDKISDVPQEKMRPMRRFIHIGAISGVAAAVMIFAVCRVFVFGGAVSDRAFENAKFAADCEAGFTVGNSAPAEVCEVNTVYGADLSEDAVHFMADMADAADVADGAAAEPETAPEEAEVYAVTSAIIASSPGFGLIAEPKHDYTANSSVKAQSTAAPEACDKSLSAPTAAVASPADRLFEKLRTNDRAVIVCDSFDGATVEKADAEEIITFDGTEFMHMTFTKNADVLYSDILDMLESGGVYYCAAAPEGGYEYFELFFGMDSEK